MIINVTTQIKCDARDCKNDAAAYFEVKGRAGKCFLCQSCLEKLTAETRMRTVPKSPQNVFKRKADRAEVKDEQK